MQAKINGWKLPHCVGIGQQPVSTLRFSSADMRPVYTCMRSWWSFPMGFVCGQVDLRCLHAAACHRHWDLFQIWCCLFFKEEQSVNKRRWEENLLVCQVGREKGKWWLCAKKRRSNQSWRETVHVTAVLVSWFLLLCWLCSWVMLSVCCTILKEAAWYCPALHELLGKVGSGWIACVKQTFLYLYYGHNDNINNGGSVWTDGSPLPVSVGTAGTGAWIALPGCSRSEANNCSQFCSSFFWALWSYMEAERTISSICLEQKFILM